MQRQLMSRDESWRAPTFWPLSREDPATLRVTTEHYRYEYRRLLHILLGFVDDAVRMTDRHVQVYLQLIMINWSMSDLL